MKLSIHRGAPGSPIIYLNAAEDVSTELIKLLPYDFTLAAITGLSWNSDLTPWPAPALFGDGEPFPGNGDAYLDLLLNEIIPETEKGGRPAWRGIAGYSLAGLFAIYSLTKTDLFQRAASVSGSLWYPGIIPAVLSSDARPQCLYLSLGDRESRGRAASVLGNTERIASHFSDRGVPVLFELNTGNHFTEPLERTAKALSWLLSFPQTPSQSLSRT